MARQAAAAAASQKLRAARAAKASQEQAATPAPAKPLAGLVELADDLVEQSPDSMPMTPVKRRAVARQLSDVSDAPAPAPKRRRAATGAASPVKSAAALPPAERVEAPAVYPLLGREEECRTLDAFFEEALSGSSGCLYVSGGPGTGKTCSVAAATAQWRSRCPTTRLIQVNCMSLSQRTPTGLLVKVGEVAAEMGAVKPPLPRTGTQAALLSAVAARLAALGPSVIIVADEVDQVLNRRQVGPGLETVFAIAQAPGAPAVAFVAIANHVDLLERSGARVADSACRSLPFQPYSAVQLRSIAQALLKTAGSAGEAAVKALSPMQLEMAVRQVAKYSGDCRRIANFVESALFNVTPTAAEADTDGADQGTAPAAPVRPVPLKAAASGPLDQLDKLLPNMQVLLVALASAKGEALKLAEVRSRYNEFARQLSKSTDDEATSDEVRSWVSSLELKGLLAMRQSKGSGGSRKADTVVELSVSCKALRERIIKVNPLLGSLA